MMSNSLPAAARSQVKSTLPQKKTKPLFLYYRFMIFYRFALAVLGGYCLSALSATVIAQVFVADKTNAAMSATLIAFCIYCGSFIWVFMVNKTWKVSAGIILPTLLLWAVYKFLGH